MYVEVLLLEAIMAVRSRLRGAPSQDLRVGALVAILGCYLTSIHFQLSKKVRK